MDLALRSARPSSASTIRGARSRKASSASAAMPTFFCAIRRFRSGAPDHCIMGPCAGGAVYSPSITDFNVMVKHTSYMFITPRRIRTVPHEDVTKIELGGAETHNSISGVAHFAAETDQHALQIVREILSFIHRIIMEDPPRAPATDPVERTEEKLNTIIPEAANQPYDIRDCINAVVDDRYFFEVHAHYAPNIVVGFSRLAGRSVGIVANQPAYLAGVLDIDASVKGGALRPFVDVCLFPLSCSRTVRVSCPAGRNMAELSARSELL